MPIITDGLARYYHFAQGVSGTTWENIAPNYKSISNATLVGATLTQSGIQTDGIDDHISVPVLTLPSNNITIECVITPDAQTTGNKSIISAGLGQQFYIENGSVYAYIGSNSDIGRTAGNQFIANVETGVSVYIAYKIDVLNNIITVFVSNEKVEFLFSGSALTLASNNWSNKTLSFGRQGGSSNANYRFKGEFSFVRIYDRALSDEEIVNNLAVGTNLGLDREPVVTVPKVTKAITNKPKISDEIDMNQSIITVQFDTDVIEYVARLNGSDYSTGSLVHQGGAVPANTDAQVIIDWDELPSEGVNRINIYGKSVDGQWTPYAPN